MCVRFSQGYHAYVIIIVIKISGWNNFLILNPYWISRIPKKPIILQWQILRGDIKGYRISPGVSYSPNRVIRGGLENSLARVVGQGNSFLRDVTFYPNRSTDANQGCLLLRVPFTFSLNLHLSSITRPSVIFRGRC